MRNNNIKEHIEDRNIFIKLMLFVLPYLALMTLLTAFLVLTTLLTACSPPPQPEPVDLSDDIGYIYFEPTIAAVPPMPNGYITREVIKEEILETFIITDTTVIDLVKPYYKPFAASAYYNVLYTNYVDRIAYNYPFYSCDDYTQSVWGDFNNSATTANMPVFFAHVITPEDDPHAVLVVFYNNDLWYIECTACDYAGIIPHDEYELVLLIG